MVAADVRRRRFGQLSSGNPPPHVGGYAVLKHVLRTTEALRRLGGGVAHHAILLLATLGLLLAGSERSRAAETSVPKEYQIKAAFLYNFTKFVEWPDSAFADPNKPIVIGVLGPNPFGGELAKAIEGRKVNGRDLVLQTIQKVDDLKAVHVLFIGSEEDRKLAEHLAALKGNPVLTVGETEIFAKRGGIITFSLEGDKVRFEINMESAEQGGLKISAQLQKLAKSVRRKS